MKSGTVFALVLLSSFPSFSQEMKPKAIGKPEVKKEEPEEKQTDTFQASLEGADRMILKVLAFPGALKDCGSADELQTEITKRFAADKPSPQLGKGGEPNLPTLEYWLETPADSPAAFAGANIPEGVTAFAVRVRATVLYSPVEGLKMALASATALDGRTVWWGDVKECGEGLKKALSALNDRVLAEYRSANRPAKSPKK